MCINQKTSVEIEDYVFIYKRGDEILMNQIKQKRHLTPKDRMIDAKAQLSDKFGYKKRFILAWIKVCNFWAMVNALKMSQATNRTGFVKSSYKVPTRYEPIGYILECIKNHSLD